MQAKKSTVEQNLRRASDVIIHCSQNQGSLALGKSKNVRGGK